MSTDPVGFWAEMERPGPSSITIAGATLRRGSRVRLRPNAGGDVMDKALAGRTAVVESIEQDDAGAFHVIVTIDDDPGRDLGMQKMPGHRFFFRADEVEPLAGPARVLVAGIGNIFLGDDGFGTAVARRLADSELPDEVTVRDFGIRGMDLAYALRDYDAVVFVDAVPRGNPAGTLYVIDASGEGAGPPAVSTHAMDPVRVLALARALGPVPARVLVVGCEPGVVPDPDSDEIVAGLSPPVDAAVHTAVTQVEGLVRDLLQQEG